MKKVTIDERWFRYGLWSLLCVAILGGGIMFSMWLKKSGPVAKTVATVKHPPLVTVEEVVMETAEIQLSSNGEVSPVRRTILSAEVGGKLVRVHDSLEAGEVFQAGDLLLQVESADYDATLAAANAKLADVQLALQLEESRQAQAMRDWAKLGNGGEPSDLVKRIPHLASAQAAVAAAQGAIEKAQRDVERTSITAPYECRVERTFVDLGAVVSPGMQLVEIVSQGPVEVRLPLSLEDYGYLQRGDDGRVFGEVVATGMIGATPREWRGTLVRSEEIVDRSTRSINVVAEFGRGGAEAPAIGMFVKTLVSGRSVPNIVKVPRAAMLDGRNVLLLTEANTLEFRPVEVLRTELDRLLVSGGLRNGERVVTTPPSAPIPGTEVRVLDPHEAAGSGTGGTGPAKPKPAGPAS